MEFFGNDRLGFVWKGVLMWFLFDGGVGFLLNFLFCVFDFLEGFLIEVLDEEFIILLDKIFFVFLFLFIFSFFFWEDGVIVFE